jgi:hypothetical protein
MRPTLRKIALGCGTAIKVGVIMAAIPAPANAQHHNGRHWRRGYPGFRSGLPLGHYYGYPLYRYDYDDGLAYEPDNAEDEGERNCLWRRRQ